MDRTMSEPLPHQLARWRSDTPGCARLVHLNNAGAALVPRPVRDAVAGHLALEEEVGGYEAAEAGSEPGRARRTWRGPAVRASP